MKSPLALAAGTAAFVFFVAPVSAVDVQNADDDSYEVSITSDNGEAANFELMPGDRERDVCSMRCTVKVGGVGSIVADEDDLVVIRDRKLSKDPKRL